MSSSTYEQGGISHSRFGDHAIIHQGNVQGNVYYNGIPHPPACPEVVRVIPYPRNDKTQIALDYAYRRCDADDKCCVFWVHADSEANFVTDYKTIGRNLRIDGRLDGSDLLKAVRNEIEARSEWVMILDNADDLRLFGVGQREKENGVNDNLYNYVPHASQGTVVWTSRDERITGSLVGSPRGIAVQSMALDEATTLLAMAKDQPLTSSEAGVRALLEELQYLPLAVSQAGLYMRRMSISAEKYLDLLRQGRTRWEVLKISNADRHRRPEVSNSILETWRISIERIRSESELSYRMLHAVAYVDNQDIPHELITATVDHIDKEDEHSTRQTTELEIFGDVARLEEFSFLSIRQETDLARALEAETGPEKDEAYYAGIALQAVEGLFPEPQPISWTRCEQYMAHAMRVGEWAEVAGTERETSMLLRKVSDFLR
ncbi:hypothetical protein NW762_009329 [Fusarium torreyae]|uniref:NB-ARC domain-containing protein n=1 Tax=Fusarium torreyae TaxID=1237075 RepID=A0A9W8VEY2_9HYPO|nr:hypothetical protein NW762_009329 [Fusarium torreyae]